MIRSLAGLVKILATVGGICSSAHVASRNEPDVRLDWSSFKSQYGKRYVSGVEELRRFEIFANNKIEIDHFNAEESEQAGFLQGLNHFSDMSNEEIQQLNSGRRYTTRHSSAMAASCCDPDSIVRLVPEQQQDDEPKEEQDSVDWRLKGRVSSIKDQGDCGSDWAFVTVGLLEGQENVSSASSMNNESLTDLSVQQLIDCSGGMNCDGGNIPGGLEYLIQHGSGLMSDRDYPYEARNGAECKFDISKVAIAGIKNFTILPIDDELSLKEVVARYGPVAASIDGTLASFVRYKSGIYSDPKCGPIISQSVLIVGYGRDTADKGDYWIVKNFHGRDWGEEGYMRMAMGKNMCSIAHQPIIANF